MQQLLILEKPTLPKNRLHKIVETIKNKNIQKFTHTKNHNILLVIIETKNLFHFQYTLLLGLVFLLELFVGGLAYFYESQIQDEIREDLNGTFLTSYGMDEARTRAIDMMQIEYKCCGAIRFEDWRASYWFHQNESLPIIRLHGNRLVPDSCCITITENCGSRDHPSNIPYTVSFIGFYHRIFTEN